MTSPIATAIQQICHEKGISKESVLETIESALAAAYRKDFGNKMQNIKVQFDIETGQSRVFDVKTVVEDLPEDERALWLKGEWPPKPEGEAVENQKMEGKNKEKEEKTEAKEKEKTAEKKVDTTSDVEEEEEKRFNPKTEIQITDAQEQQKGIDIGEELVLELDVPSSYGRMATQTAKQVIIQKIREAERNMIYEDFKDKEHTIITGVVHRRDARGVLIDLGRANGILPYDQQIPGERYNQGSRIKAYITSIEMTPKGPQILLSRTTGELVRELFATEIPEVGSAAIVIREIAREPGHRSKVAVESAQENIDPIGSCVGQRGSRIQTIISELNGEKIDIIEYNENPLTYIANALSPAKTANIEIDEENKTAKVSVKEDQLSLAIGREGQNVRLAAQLTGWRIDIVGENGEVVEDMETGDEIKNNEAVDDASSKSEDATSKKTEGNKEKVEEEQEKVADPEEKKNDEKSVA